MSKTCLALALFCALSSPAKALTAIDETVAREMAHDGQPVPDHLPSRADSGASPGPTAVDHALAVGRTGAPSAGEATTIAKAAHQAAAPASADRLSTSAGPFNVGTGHKRQPAEANGALPIAHDPPEGAPPLLAPGAWAVAILVIGAVGAFMRRRHLAHRITGSRRQSSSGVSRSGGRSRRRSGRRRR